MVKSFCGSRKFSTQLLLVLRISFLLDFLFLSFFKACKLHLMRSRGCSFEAGILVRCTIAR